MMKYPLFLLAICLIFASCEKELSLENAQPTQPIPPTEPPPPPPPPPAKETRKYQLSAFYANKPIDFIDTDSEVRSEANLWGYVQEYLKDDIDEFTLDSNAVDIHQGANRIPGNDDSILHKTYSIGTDSKGTYIDFLGPDYEVLRYRLQEMTEDHLIIYLPWKNNSIIYSRFDRVY